MSNVFKRINFSGGSGGGGGDSFWSRAGSILSPVNAGDSIHVNNADLDGDITFDDVPLLVVVPPSAGGDGIQAAIEAVATAGGGIVQLLEGTYESDIPLEWPIGANNTILRGVGEATIINFTIPLTDPRTNPWAIYMLGGAAPYAAEDTAQGDTTLETTTHSDAGNLSPGQYIAIQGTDADGFTRKETNYVVSADPDTGIVELLSPLNLTLDEPNVIRYTGCFANGVCDLAITYSGGEDTAAHGVGLRNQVRSFCRNVTANGSDGSCSVFATVQDSIDCVLEDCNVRNFNHLEEYPIDTFVYEGFQFQGNLRCHVRNNNFYDMGIVGNYSNWIIDTMCEDCTFIGNRITSTRCRAITFLSTLRMTNCIFKDNRIIDSVQEAIYLSNAAYMQDTVFDGNIIENTADSTGNTKPGMNFVTPTVAKNLTIINNQISGCGGEGMSLVGVTFSVIDGNKIFRCNQADLFMYLGTNNTISNNNFSNSSIAGIYMISCTKSSITGNILNNHTSTGIGFRSDGSCSDIVFSGNTSLDNSSKAFKLENSDDWFLVVGNNFHGGTVTQGTGANNVFDNNLL